MAQALDEKLAKQILIEGCKTRSFSLARGINTQNLVFQFFDTLDLFEVVVELRVIVEFIYEVLPALDDLLQGWQRLYDVIIFEMN